MKTCVCPDWEPNERYLTSMILKYPSSSMIFYNITIFKYCPYCGRLLTEIVGTSPPEIEPDGTLKGI